MSGEAFLGYDFPAGVLRIDVRVTDENTLRDLLAATAMNGYIMRSHGNDAAEYYARLAYQVADAMLAERGTGK